MDAVDLFCGAGGSSIGATRAGVVVRYAVNHWTVAIQTHEANLPGTKHIHSRVEHLDPRRFGGIDLLLASPECTNHSLAKGAKPRDEQSRMTAWEVVRFAEGAAPRWIVVENVPEIRLWTLYTPWKDALQRLGYRIHEHVFNSADFGVPQARRRYFLVAGRNEEPPPIVPPGKCCRSIRDVIRWNGYPMQPVAEKAESTLRKVQAGVRALGPDEPFLIVYYGSGSQWQSLDRPLRTITTRDRFGLVAPGGLGGHMMRMLQPPELAEAMGFPPGYRLTGSRRDQVTQIGNAVVPAVMEHVVRELRGVG